MSRRVLVGFILVNVVVSLAVAWLVISFSRKDADESEPPAAQVQVKIVSATPPPGGEVSAADSIGTANALALTVTALANQSPSILIVTATPAEVAGVDVPPVPTLPTINPSFLPPIPSELPPGLPSATPETDGCIRHEVQSGEVVITIAQQYGVLPGDILLANGMQPDDILNIGDILIIPVEGCHALDTPTPVPSPSRTPFELTRVVPTVTLAATATTAQILITNVLSWGDVNNEAVELRNMGDVVNLQGWTLTSSSGDIFYFPESRMQQGSLIRVYTRQGSNTPAAFYWGLDQPMWAEGDTVSLIDAEGNVQSTFRVGDAPVTPGQ